MAEIPWVDGKTPVAEGSVNVTGPTWQNKIATALARLVSQSVRNADGFALDVDTVSGAGIGVTTPIAKNVDLDTLTAGGFYYCYYNAAYHFPGTDSGNLLVLPSSATQCVQIMWTLADQIYYRFMFSGTWSTPWAKIWNARNDGNGGQPPRAKPNGSMIAKNSLGVGQCYIENLANGTTNVYPNCGGTVQMEIYGGTSGGNWQETHAGGGGNQGTVSTSLSTCCIKWERIAL